MRNLTALVPRQQYRKPTVRHITLTGQSYPTCGAWVSGGWIHTNKEKFVELKVCAKCEKKLQNLLTAVRADPLLGDGEAREPMKAQIWRERNTKRRKRTAVITKVTDDEIWVKSVTDINGKEIAPVMRQRKATRIPIEHWSRDWIPA